MSEHMYSSYWRKTLADRAAKGTSHWGVEGFERRNPLKGLIYRLALARYWTVALSEAERPFVAKLRPVF